ncbi:OmpA family protein [Mucilaginibacter lappiensis]|uniref:Outer membrane protein OmpA-like peptidoglycan-associated protein n=1 Tax=Mucilaginibacter lappiensis TaxID=354630 RepID=A0A1N6ZZK5_9SPHI|nr:OmpA family protein [Mucilaginibacter lappiensis]MBB6110378.1 outer membrane protein OmpA-like peptidoglycan-associated protein [Mucilaginibacter lappiensis]MBB6128516.1 outer membrane protein OmpA-like peptidoglycan-associated protein [Mucilaginibacter lappiensis]SIR32241.1 Outer membrane protein OmpA [Mucilaginibacter lappiensis]
MKTLRIKIATLSLALATVGILGSGCDSLTKTQKGAAIGAGAGGTIGAFIGKAAGNTALGAIIGGAVGGTAGAFIGRNMDRQAAEIKQTVPGATVTREGEGILVKFDSGILFDTNKSDLKPEAQSNLQKLATSLQNNQNTNILIVGHTDNTGSDSYNMDLSVRRAESVKSYIAANNVSPSRLTTSGKGESEPIADNTTVEGRAQNRRVEIVIVANDQMKQQAKQSAQ